MSIHQREKTVQVTDAFDVLVCDGCGKETPPTHPWRVVHIPAGWMQLSVSGGGDTLTEHAHFCSYVCLANHADDRNSEKARTA